MADALFASRPVFDLPLTKGDDLSVTFVYKEPVTDEDGEFVLDDKGRVQYAAADYPDGATVALEVDTKPARSFDAVITGSEAYVHQAFTVTDLIPKNTPWRVKITYTGGLNKVAAHGKTVRND